MPPDDSIFSRQTPHSPEAERSVIGSMLIDPRCVADVIGLLSRDDFYSETNRDIYAAIQSMFNNARLLDPVVLLDYMRENGTFTDQTPEYIYDLMDLTPTAANVMAYARIVLDQSLLRAIADTGAEITQLAVSGEGGAETVLDAAEQKVYDLRKGRSASGLEPITKILASVFQQIAEASKQGAGITGIPTGLTSLDNRIMGMNRSDLIIIASRPGMGKTSLALNIARNSALSTGKTIVFFSLEMSPEQLGIRLLSSESRIDNKKLQTGRISNDEWVELTTAANTISRADILINDKPTLGVSEMNALCRRIKNLGLVIIDHMQLIKSPFGTGRSGYSADRVQIVTENSRLLKIMAKELNVPVVCACQLSRSNESRQDKRPMLSDLRESGSIEQDADIVLGLYRESYYNRDTEDVFKAECLILKNRRGETGKIEMHWSPELTKYTAVDTTHTDEYA